MIRIENISKTYPGRDAARALDSISLQVGRGEIFGVIGRSGAGKSTLIRCLNLLERPDSGRIFLEDEALTALSPRQLPDVRRRIGMVFQHFNLLQSKTVAQNVAFPLTLAGNRDKAAVRRRVAELLDLVGLSALGDRYPASLSGGQKQRVGIARALANKPRVLLSDEATSALDPQTTQSILDLLLDINRRLGLTIVLITHEMSVIRSLCDRVAVLERGQIVESGPVTDVFLHPRHAVTRSLLAESGQPDERELARLAGRASGPLLRLTFVGEKTYAPLLSQTSRETGLEFNILQGSIGRIKDTPYGQLLIEAVAGGDALPALQAALTRRNIHHEVIA